MAPHPRRHQETGKEKKEPRAFLLLLYSAQVGQAFVPAPQRTGLEACLYLSRTRYTKWRNALVGSISASRP